MDYTEKLVKTYDKIIASDEFRYPHYCAEHILMINYMRANYGDVTDIFEHNNSPRHDSKSEQKEFLMDAFECIDINLLKDLVLCKRENHWDTKSQGDWVPIKGHDRLIVKDTREFFK